MKKILEMRGIDSDDLDLRGAIEMGKGGKDKGGKGGKGGPDFYGRGNDPMGLNKSGKSVKGRNKGDPWDDDAYGTNKSNKIHPDDQTPNFSKKAKSVNSGKVNWDFVGDSDKNDYDPFKKIEKGEYDEFREWKRIKNAAKKKAD